MQNYKVVLTKNAVKEIKKLDTKAKKSIKDAIQILAINPFSDALRVKKLKKEKNLYRLRVGDYRVIYEVKNEQLLITVVRLGHRKDVYRYLKSK